MVQPHLLPTAADLVRFAAVLLVAACTTGMGFLTGARRIEIAFFGGWGLACLVFVAVGTWTQADLIWAAGLCGLLGGIGLTQLLPRFRAAPRPTDWLGPRVLLLGLPFLLLVLGIGDIAWDDLTFWVPNLLHLCTSHRFPSLADPATFSAMPAYPYGLALPGFATYMLGVRQVDTVAIVWNLLAMLAAGAAFANVIARRLSLAGMPPDPALPWVLAALGVLLMGMANPTFVAKLTLSNMGDSATGAGLAVLCALLFEYLAEPPRTSGRASVALQISLTACAVIFIRQANAALLLLLILSVAAGLLALSRKMSAANVGRFVAVLVLPALLWWSWTHYADRQIPNGRHTLLSWHAWHWQVFGATLRAAWRAFVSKSGYAMMLLAMGAIALNCLLRRLRGQAPFRSRPDGTAGAIIAVTTAGLAFGNIAFLLFCYLATSFDPTEAEAAISFWRFIAQTGQSLTIGFACLMPLAWLDACLRPRWVRRALPAVTLLVPIAATSAYRDDLRSPVPTLRRIAEGLRGAVPAGAPIALVDVTGNGFAALVVRYQLHVIDGDGVPLPIVSYSHGLSPVLAEQALPADAPYVWLAAGVPASERFLGTSTDDDCSYLFRRDTDGYRVLRTWAIGRYRWSIAPQPEAPATAGGCGN